LLRLNYKFNRPFSEEKYLSYKKHFYSIEFETIRYDCGYKLILTD